MTNKQPTQPDDPNQSDRFAEAAKAVGADESGAAFDRAMGVVVPPSSRPSPTESPPARPPKNGPSGGKP